VQHQLAWAAEKGSKIEQGVGEHDWEGKAETAGRWVREIEARAEKSW